MPGAAAWALLRQRERPRGGGHSWRGAGALLHVAVWSSAGWAIPQRWSRRTPPAADPHRSTSGRGTARRRSARPCQQVRVSWAW